LPRRKLRGDGTLLARGSVSSLGDART